MCGGDAATPTSNPTPTTPPTAAAPSATATAPAPTATSAAMMELDVSTVLIALDELNNSSQAGWAKLTAKGDDTEIVLSLSTGNMVSKMVSKAVHIHAGQCDSLGGVAHALTGDFAVSAHNTDDPGIYTSCGDLPAREPVSGAPTVNLQSPIVNAILLEITISVGTFA